MPRINVPRSQELQPIKYKPARDFTQEILAIQSRNPLSEAITQVGNIGSAAIKRRGDIAQLMALGKKYGLEESTLRDLASRPETLDAATSIISQKGLTQQLKTTTEKEAEGLGLEKTRAEIDKLKRQKTYIIPQYDKNGNIIGYSELPEGTTPFSAPRPPAAGTSGGLKPPPGYRFTQDGSLEAIPGGPAYVKTEEARAKEKAATESQTQEANLVISKIDSALQNVSNLSAGFGAATKNVPGSPAMNLSADLETIQSSLGLNKLMEMKALSKAGASGLGQLSDREMNLLTSAIASLKQSQTPGQLKSKLNEVKDHYKNILKMGEGINPYQNRSLLQKPQEPEVVQTRKGTAFKITGK